MKDPAFQSQQFADRVQARTEGHIRDQGAIVSQGAQGIAQGVLAGQEFAMKRMQVNADLALNETRRQSAMEELAWARELHSTDMLAMQKEAMRAQTGLAVAQAEAARKKLGEGQTPPLSLSEEERDAALAAGIDITFKDGRPAATEATPERRKEGASRIAARDALKRFRDPEDAALAGFVMSDDLSGWRRGTPAEVDSVIGRARTIRSREVPTQAARDITAAVRALDGRRQTITSELFASPAPSAERATALKAELDEINKQYKIMVERSIQNATAGDAAQGAPAAKPPKSLAEMTPAEQVEFYVQDIRRALSEYNQSLGEQGK